MSALTVGDRAQLDQHGLDLAEAERQLELLRQPPAPIRLLRPCTLGGGVRRLDEVGDATLERAWRVAAEGGRLSKMVPASGAASRMFATLAAHHQGIGGAREAEACQRFRRELPRFAFFPQLDEQLRSATEAVDLDAIDDHDLLHLVLDDGLAFARKPKALIPFHRDPCTGKGRTPLEEHLLESIGYLRDAEDHCRLHFTVGDAHLSEIRSYLAFDPNRLLIDRQEVFEVAFSTQSPATDTLALNAGEQPFRQDDGSLLLRPGGHGSLLQNLHQLGGDVVVIKNIDNVVPADRQEVVATTLRRLLGHLLRLEQLAHQALAQLSDPACGERAIDDALRLLADELNVNNARDILRRSRDAKRAFALERLHRPLRACGVVLNEGEPGGGPFWVCEQDGRVSAQIVESAQVDQHDAEQRATFSRATHFNPVLLACSLRDHEGIAYDLPRFADLNRAFVADKTQQGRPLRALEHPGLWNGAMAHWNTVFFEVPTTVFAPVKTIFDLLRPEHQSA